MRTMSAVFASSALVVGLVAGGAGAQRVLYTLASPNEEVDGHFGISVSGAGDVNDDGHDDVIVGAWSEDPGTSPTDAGRAYVFSGATGALIYTLASPNEEASGCFGLHNISGAGDVDNDGYADVVVGAYQEDPGDSPTDAGRAYVFSGATGETLYTLVSPNEEAQGYFGSTVSGAGDVDNDGLPDVIVGASRPSPWVGPGGEGRAYIFSGQTGGLLHTLNSPSDTTGHFGNWVSGAGDLNNDDHADVIVGAWYENPGTSPDDAGRAYVFSGATGETLYTLISPNEEGLGRFGTGVSGVGDVDQDGTPDVVVGAPWEDPGGSPTDAGRAYVFSGATGTLLYTLVSPNEEAGGWFGTVSGAGDVDNDGCPDVVVGAMHEDPDASPTDAGRAYVFSGQNGALLCTLISVNEEVVGRFGFCVSGAGDVGSDPHVGVVVGAPGEFPGASPMDAGRAYVFSYEPPASAPDDGVVTPSLLTLRGPFPNPTDGSVRLAIQVLDSAPGHVDLSLYGVSGRRIAAVLDETVQGGENLTLTWCAPRGLSPGVYWWRLKAGAQSVQRSMVIAK